MADDVDNADGARREGSAAPFWDQLPAETRAEYINHDVEKVIAESKAATKEIVADAIKTFEEDYAAIKSKSIRVSVLRNIAEEPLPVDAEEADAPIPGHLPPPPSNRPAVPIGRSGMWSFFLNLLGLG